MTKLNIGIRDYSDNKGPKYMVVKGEPEPREIVRLCFSTKGVLLYALLKGADGKPGSWRVYGEEAVRE